MQVKKRSNPTAHEERYSYTYLLMFRCRRGFRKSKCVLPFWLWVYSGYMHVARACSRPGPVWKRCVCMHEYNHFILGNRLLRWYNTITMRPWCIHFGGEIQQAAATNIISSSTQINLVFRRSPDRGIHQVKKTGPKYDFSHSYEYACWVLVHTTCVIYMQKSHPTRNLLFILTWREVWCRFLVLLITPA